MQPIATDGLGAGIEKNYLKDGDARIIAHTKVIGAGEKDSVTFDVSKLDFLIEKYGFFCSFPGHISMMKGTLDAEVSPASNAHKKQKPGDTCRVFVLL